MPLPSSSRTRWKAHSPSPRAWPCSTRAGSSLTTHPEAFKKNPGSGRRPVYFRRHAWPRSLMVCRPSSHEYPPQRNPDRPARSWSHSPRSSMVLIYLGAPGVFTPQNKYRIYFENAAGIKPGAPRCCSRAARSARCARFIRRCSRKTGPGPKLETLIEVQVNFTARIFNKVKAQIAQPTMLGDSVIDFSNGEELQRPRLRWRSTSIGERAAGLSELAPDGHGKPRSRSRPSSPAPSIASKKPPTTSPNSPPKAPTCRKPSPSSSNSASTSMNSSKATTARCGTRCKTSRRSPAINGKLASRSTISPNRLTGPDGSLSKTFKNTEKFTNATHGE